MAPVVGRAAVSRCVTPPLSSFCHNRYLCVVEDIKTNFPESNQRALVKRHYLRVGDKSTAGGVVVEGIATTSVMGQELTRLGASVMCPACKTVGHIVPVGPRFPDGWMGQKVALEGDKVSCGCFPLPTMLPSQNVMYEQYDGEGLSSMGFSSAAAATAALSDPDHWVRFKLDENGSCEGMKCTAHFADGSIQHGVVDSNNMIAFERPNSSMCEKMEIHHESGAQGGSVIDRLLGAMSS
ncbi:PAAR domain-containing protein [Burkholderia stagnalis]|uniref:PAAR domain-containing protein n=1 Tax=Burkholderia stagnalis TaxID=1503054 RepID=UPI0022AB0A36|nr:PAAR domain-containing protein [Burkholderia stagnalis]